MLGVVPDIGARSCVCGSRPVGGFARHRLRAGVRLDADKDRGAQQRRCSRRHPRRYAGLGFLDAAAVRDHGAERRALETRAAELTAQALAPGSALACLEHWPARVSRPPAKRRSLPRRRPWRAPPPMSRRGSRSWRTWSAYTSAAARASTACCCRCAARWRADRFGFLRMCLRCATAAPAENCKALALLHDPSRVRANLSAQTLERYLDHYLTVWAQAPDNPVAEATHRRRQPATVAPGRAQGHGQHRLSRLRRRFRRSAS